MSSLTRILGATGRVSGGTPHPAKAGGKRLPGEAGSEFRLRHSNRVAEPKRVWVQLTTWDGSCRIALSLLTGVHMSDTEPTDPPPAADHSREFFEEGFYAQIVSVLRAMDVKANTFTNGHIYGVQVELEDGRDVVWSNYDNWAYTIVQSDGSTVGRNTGLRPTAPPEAAAAMMAYLDYGEE